MPSPIALRRSCDAAGLTFSGLCLLHCVALPTASAVLPIAAFGEAEWVHRVFALLTLATTLGIVIGCRPVGVRFLSAATLGNAPLLWAAFAATAESAETIATVLGATILAAAHLVRLATTSRKRVPC